MKSSSMNLEQLEARDCPATMGWNGDLVLFPDYQWSSARNWIDLATGAIPAAAPGINDQAFFINSTGECHLDVSPTVNALHTTNSAALTIYVHDKTLTVRETNAALHNFSLTSGLIWFSDEGGKVIIESCKTAQWTGEGGFGGGVGKVYLTKGTYLNIKGVGAKPANTFFVVGDPADTVNSALKVDENSSDYINLSSDGQIRVTSQGGLVFANDGNFSIMTTQDNSHYLDLDGSLYHVGGGITTIYATVLMNDPGSEMVISYGGLTIDDPNDLLSVDMRDGIFEMHGNTVFDVYDGFMMTGGYFTLAGSPLDGQFSNRFWTRGDFYFEDGYVSFIQSFQEPLGIEWWNTRGEIVLGDGCTLSMNISPDPNKCDKLWADKIILGGELRVNQIGYVAPDTEIHLIGGRLGQLFNGFDEMYWCGDALPPVYNVSTELETDATLWMIMTKW